MNQRSTQTDPNGLMERLRQLLSYIPFAMWIFFLNLEWMVYGLIHCSVTSTTPPNPRQRTVVSMTTIPSRSRWIHLTLLSILRQRQVPDKIYITIATRGLRESGIHDMARVEFLQRYFPIEIVHTDTDHGPIMKLYGAVKCEADPGTRIITMDDDSYYHPNTIARLVAGSIAYPDHVIATVGREQIGSCKREKVYGFDSSVSRHVPYVEGYGGVLYRRGMFDIGFFRTRCMSDMLNDDMVISAHLRDTGIRCVCIPHECREPIPTSFWTSDTNPLWMVNENVRTNIII